MRVSQNFTCFIAFDIHTFTFFVVGAYYSIYSEMMSNHPPHLTAVTVFGIIHLKGTKKKTRHILDQPK